MGFCFLNKVFKMQVSTSDFFEGLKVNVSYYIKLFKSLGVKSSFIFDKDDLALISAIPVRRYKSQKVVKRANDILGVQDV